VAFTPARLAAATWARIMHSAVARCRILRLLAVPSRCGHHLTTAAHPVGPSAQQVPSPSRVGAGDGPPAPAEELVGLCGDYADSAAADDDTTALALCRLARLDRSRWAAGPAGPARGQSGCGGTVFTGGWEPAIAGRRG
jgi:hypothetical protein